MKFTSEISVKLLRRSGSDEDIATAALVIEPEAYDDYRKAHSKHTTEGLIRYLMEHRHGTPFEHGSMSFLVHAPIFVWREWHRHRIGFCLAGCSVLDFVVPSVRERRTRTIAEFHRMWHHSRSNKMPVVRRMRLRCLDLVDNLATDTGVLDVFESGVKRVYLVKTAGGNEVVCSADHRFWTPDGWKPVSDFSRQQQVITTRRRGQDTTVEAVEPSESEEWRTYDENDGYEVSSHGRVRSYYSQGTGRKQKTPTLKTITRNTAGRAVVNVGGEVVQVSRMVYRAFHGDVPAGMGVLHCDDNPMNNCLANLYAGTDQDNKDDAARNGRRPILRGVEDSVASVSLIGEEQTYDIEVEHHDSNFTVDGVVVHNSYNEESGRYKTLEPVFYIPPKDRPIFKVDNWKPGRPKFLTLAEWVQATGESFTEAERRYERLLYNLKKSYVNAYTYYQDNLELEIDPGLARDCLPVGIYSSCWVTCNPRSMMAFLSLRTHEPKALKVSYPLYEMEVAARKCEDIFAAHWPKTMAAFNDFGRLGP